MSYLPGIQKKAYDEESEEDFSADEDEDFKPENESESSAGKSDTDTGSDSESESDQKEEPPRGNLKYKITNKSIQPVTKPAPQTPIVSFRSERLRNRQTKQLEFLPQSDNYFTSHNSNKVLFSTSFPIESF